MVDIVDKKTRSRMMSGIRGTNTSPELVVRKFLFAAGFRFRLHAKNVPGRPDIVLPKLRSVVLVHGCFWHRHSGCKFAYTPRSNIRFWKDKFAANVARDRTVRRLLKRASWDAHTIWECEVNAHGLNRLRRDLERKRRELGA
jgi:DNA mismatch endonuclease (patch repair protein)